jgi:hypothetical protein
LHVAYAVELLYIRHLITWVGVSYRRASNFRLIFYKALFSSIISQFRYELHEIAASHSFQYSGIHDDFSEYTCSKNISPSAYIFPNSAFLSTVYVYRTTLLKFLSKFLYLFVSQKDFRDEEALWFPANKRAFI